MVEERKRKRKRDLRGEDVDEIGGRGSGGAEFGKDENDDVVGEAVEEVVLLVRGLSQWPSHVPTLLFSLLFFAFRQVAMILEIFVPVFFERNVVSESR